MKRGPKAKDWFPNDKATHEWLDSMKKGTRSTHQALWKLFIEFTGMTGDQILESRKADKDYTWEKKVVEFKRWAVDVQNKSEKSSVTASAVARSFFSYYRLPLQFRRSESAILTEAKRVTEDYRFSREDLKKMADVADLTEKYVIVAGKSFGLRAGDFLALTRGDLEPYINRDVPICIGPYATQKESVKAYPFIDSDVQPVIKLMLEKMNREGRTDPNERILPYSYPIQLSRVLKRVAERAGIKHGNKKVRFHCLRKFLTDRLSSYMSESKWKQIVGKTISEAAYVSPNSLREDYTRAMSETTFTKAVLPEDMELLTQKQTLIEMAKTFFHWDDNRIKKVFRLRRATTTPEEIRALREAIEQERRRSERGETATNGGCQNGNCQRIVSEEELPTFLTQGWRVAAVLPSGRVVVSKEMLQ